jgi:hypothetical protein
MADDINSIATPPPQTGVLVPQSVAQLGYQQMELRKKIALQMMAQHQKSYPKNLGEGLTSLGNSMGDIGMMQMLMRQQQAQDADRQARQAEADREAAPDAPVIRAGGV